jgi:catecholate siderophore receptor
LPCPAEIAPGFFLPSGPRGLVRDQDNELLHNQTDLRVVSGNPGAPRNTLVVGAAFTREDYDITTASLLRNADGSAVVPLPVISLSDPDTVYTGPLNKTVTARATSWSRNVAGYVFDTLELTEKFELNAGLRYEQVHAEFRNIPLATPPPGTLPLTPLQSALQVSDEDLFSYRAGAVFKPVPTLSLYGAYGNAKTPSSATVRLGCGVVTAPGGANPCATAPEEARNYEVGAKADVFDRQMQLTLAVFRNERSNYRVASNDPSLPATLQVRMGSRVSTASRSARRARSRRTGRCLRITLPDSRVVQGIFELLPRESGTTGCNNSAAVPDPQRGNELVQTPRHAGSLFTSYRCRSARARLRLHLSGRFRDEQQRARKPDAVSGRRLLVHRVFVSYAFDNGFTAQLNVQNLTDESYSHAVRTT